MYDLSACQRSFLAQPFNSTGQACGDLSFFLSRHILAATHFNFNLDREEDCRETDGALKLKVTWPKFLNGEAKIRTVRIKQNYGREKCELVQ